MTNNFYNLISDTDLDIELLRNLKERKLEQKHFYTIREAAVLFYQQHRKVPRPYFNNSLNNDDYLNFFQTNIINQKENIAIISLGCGNAQFEKNILNKVYYDGLKFTYIGVDSSKHMLNLAQDNLLDCKFGKNFICADFGSYNFRSEVGYLINKYDNKLFILAGSTLGNITPTYISDMLANLLNESDHLWIVVALREGVRKEDDFKIFYHYSDYLKESSIKEHYFSPLKRMGVSMEDGQMTLDMEEEKSVGALKFIFSFVPNKKIIVKFREEIITILPEEKIELFNIRAYDKETFINFFKEHDFECVVSESKGNRGQFLFRKK